MRSHRVPIVASILGVLSIGLGLSLPASARDDRLKFSIKAALSSPAARAKLDPKVALYFGKSAHPPGHDLGSYSSSKKTRALGKSDQNACEWAFLSAVLDLQDRVRQLQGFAMVAIESSYKNEVIVSQDEFICGAGTMMAGVSLRGQVIKSGGK
jgi:hypothetical protein